MRMLRNREKLCRLTATLLCLCMAVSAFAGVSVPKLARAEEFDGGTKGVKREADPSTMDAYKTALDIGTNSRYAGRVWADKTVFALGDNRDDDWNGSILTLNWTDDGIKEESVDSPVVLNDDFLHVFSVLGSSQNVNTESIVPLDVVLLLDISTSMTEERTFTAPGDRNSDAAHTVINEANSLIDTLMGNNKEIIVHNTDRIGVVVYGGGSQVVLPLGRYTKSGSNNYLSIQEESDDNKYWPQITTHVQQQADKTTQFMYADSTYLQGALYQGMHMLATEENTTYVDRSGKVARRMPILIVLTDGGTNVVGATQTQGYARGDVSNEYITNDNALNFWNPLAWSEDQTTAVLPTFDANHHYPQHGGNPIYASVSVGGNSDAVPSRSVAVLLTAGYMKKWVEANYNSRGAGAASVNMQGFGIGLNVDNLKNDEPTQLSITMNPKEYLMTSENDQIKLARKNLQSYIEGNAPKMDMSIRWYYTASTRQPLKGHWEFEHPSSSNDGNPDYDIKSIEDLYYIDKYMTASTETIGDIFRNIIQQVNTSVYIPVGGDNDLGVTDSLTYIDPVGKYMEVKDVDSVTLFGKRYKLVKAGVYDYQFNNTYMEDNDLGAGSASFSRGWYHMVEGKAKPAYEDKKTLAETLPLIDESVPLKGTYASAEDAREDGWEYYFDADTAQQFASTLEEVGVEGMTDKQQNTLYTFYRFEMDKIGEENDHKDLTGIKNPSYGEKVNGEPVVTFDLNNIRIWDEDTGDYDDETSGNLMTSKGYDEALYINIPVEALPVRTVTINEVNSGDSVSYQYKTNLNDPDAADRPLRVYYTVGLRDDLTNDEGEIDLLAGINKEYLEAYKVTDDAVSKWKYGVDSSDVDVGDVLFYSNWYNETNRYTGYASNEAATGYTFGDAAITFSPSVDNSYYIAQEALPIYVLIDQNKISGRPNAVLLKSKDEAGIKTELSNLAEGSRATQVTQTNTGGVDWLQPDFWYYVIVHYYEPDSGSSGNCHLQYIAVPRKGSEFGSVILGEKNKAAYLCWHNDDGDKTESLTNTEGTYKDPPDDSGNWHVALTKGGLRTGDFAANVRGKGENYTSKDFKDDNGETTTYGYYDGNVTRTANNYYLPVVSSRSTSATGGAIFNIYLGNNGRMWFSDGLLMVTKLVEQAHGSRLTNSDEAFNYQIYVNGWTGPHTAILLKYDETNKGWMRQAHYIDLVLGNYLCLRDTNDEPARFDSAGNFVVSDGAGGWKYPDGRAYEGGEPYYLYLGTNSTTVDLGNSERNIFRVMHTPHDEYTEEVDAGIIKKEDPDNAAISTYSVSKNKAKLISALTYAEWETTPESFNSANVVGTAPAKDILLLSIEPKQDDNENSTYFNITSDFMTDSAYQTIELNFGGLENNSDVFIPGVSFKDNVAEFQLKNKEGILLSSITNSAGYIVAEQLSTPQVDAGTSIKRVEHKTVKGTETVRPGNGTQVSSMSGNASSNYENHVHYVNTVSTDKTETEINGEPVTPSPDNPELYPGVKVGDAITYTINWKNTGAHGAHVYVVDPLDEGVDFVSAEFNSVKLGANPDGTSTSIGPQSIEMKGTDDVPFNCDVTISYHDANYVDSSDPNAKTHAVIWDFGEVPSTASGTVTLTVRVNSKAKVYWNYETEANPPSNDYLVRDRAEIHVAGNRYTTHIVENPVEQPSKTETAIDNPTTSSHVPVTEPDNLERTGRQGQPDRLDGPPVNVGERITYQITWHNGKNEPATILVRDLLDPNVKLISATFDTAKIKPEVNENNAAYEGAKSETLDLRGVTLDADGKPADRNGTAISYKKTKSEEDDPQYNVEWNLGTQAAGAEGSVELTVEVLPGAAVNAYEVVNTAYVAVGNEWTQTEEVHNPTPFQSKTETKPGANELVTVGQQVEYQIEWRNDLPTDANVIVMDTLDPGVTFVDAGFNDSYEPPAKPVTATVDLLPLAEGPEDLKAPNDGSRFKHYFEKGGTYSYYLAADNRTEETTQKIYVPAHTVLWDLGKKASQDQGAVILSVTVNEKAKIEYDYNGNYKADFPEDTTKTDGTGSVFTPNPYDGTDDTSTDWLIHNQARTKLENNPYRLTEKIDNPVIEKTEDTPGDDKLVGVGEQVTYSIHWANTNETEAEIVIIDPLDIGAKFVSATFCGYDDEGNLITPPGLTLDTPEGKVSAEYGGTNPAVKDEVKIYYNTDNPDAEEKIGTETVKVPVGSVVWRFTASGKTDGVVKLTVEVTEDAKKTWTYNKAENGTYANGYGGSAGTETETDYKLLNRAYVGVGNVASVTNVVENPLPEKTEVTPGHGQLVGEGEEITYNIRWENTKNEEAEVFIVDPLDIGVDFVSASFGEADAEGVLPTETISSTTPADYASGPKTFNVKSTLLANGEGTVRIGYSDVETDILDSDGIPVTFEGTNRKAPARSVVWSFKAAANQSGYVTLKVKVNKNAFKTWDYSEADNTRPPVSFGGAGAKETDEKTDAQVIDRAVVSVDNNPRYTDRVVNPLLEKTEVNPGDGAQVTVGQDIYYNVTWKNDLDKPAKVIVTDVLDIGLDFYAANIGGYDENGNSNTTPGAPGPLTKDTEGGKVTDDNGVEIRYTVGADNTVTVTWELGEQKSGDSGMVGLYVKVNPDAIKPWDYDEDDTPDTSGENDYEVKNRAKVQIGEKSHYTSVPENPLPAKTEVTPGDGELVGVGEEITYTIRWDNAYDKDAEVVIVDPLDVGLTFVSASFGAADKDGNLPDDVKENVTLNAGDKGNPFTDIPTGLVDSLAQGAKSVTIKYTEDTSGKSGGSVVWSFKAAPHTSGYVTLKVQVNEKAFTAWDYDRTENKGDITSENGDHDVYNRAQVTVDNIPTLTNKVENPVPEKTEETPGDGEGVGVGQDVTYTIHWKNGHETPATVIITDPLDEGVTFKSASFGKAMKIESVEGQSSEKTNAEGEISGEAAENITISYKKDTHTVTWTLKDRAAGAEGDVTLTVTVNENAVKTWTYDANENKGNGDDATNDYKIVNRAEVKIGDKGAYTAIPENPLDEKTEVTPGNGKLVDVGDEITYVIRWENEHDEDATVVITDPLDIGVDFVSASFGAAEDDGTLPEEVEEKVTLNAGDKDKGNPFTDIPTGLADSLAQDAEGAKSVTIKYTEDTSGKSGGSVVWSFTAAANQSGYVTLKVRVNEQANKTFYYEDGTPVIGTDTETDDRVVDRAQISVNNEAHVTNEVENPLNEKTEVTPGAGELVGVGEEVTYAIRWKNDTAEAAYVVVTDTLDPGVDYVSADNGGVYYPNAQDGLTINGEKMETAPRTVVWNLGMQKAGAEGAVTLTVKVNASAKQLWTYDETLDANKPDIMTGDETETDYRIVDRAKVIVGNEAHYTNDVENPVTEKTEVTPGDGELVGVGDEIVYSIIWANAYDEPAEVVIDDPLDLGLTFVSASFGEASEGGPTAEDVAKATLNAGDTEKEFTDIPASLSGSLAEDAKSVTIRYEKDETGTSGGRVVWRFKADRRTSGVVTLKVRVNESAFAAWDYVPNQNNGAPTENERDHDVYNRAQVQVGNRATLTNRVENPLPEKTEASPGDGEGVKVGQDVTYNVYWKNAHAAPATVVITDPLDGGVDFKSASFKGFTLTKEVVDKAAGATVEKTNVGKDAVPGEADGSIKIAYDKETRTVTWTLTDRAAGSSAETEGFAGLTVTVNADAVKAWTYDEKENAGSGDGTAEDHKIVNRARVEIDNRGAFTNIPENPLPAKTEVEPGEGELVGVGDEITYEIAWKNTTGREAEIQIVDPLDAGVDLVEAAFGAAVDGALPEPRITAEKAEAAGDVESDALAGSDKAVAIEYTADGRDIQHADATVTKAPARSVIWTFTAAKDASGVVTLRVKVNANAAKAWAYHPEGSEAGIGGAEGSAKDYEVADRAVVVVDNEPSYTNDVHNPVPEKTEEKTDATPGDGELVGVGDAIRYAIGWNNGENGEATVTVYDPLDMGVDFERAGVAGQAEPVLTKDTVAAHPNDDPVAVQSGDVTIAYYRNGKVAKSGSGFEIPPRTVVWTMQKRAAHASGEVSLEVTVNKKAAEGWAYAAPTADDATAGGAGVEEKDYEVVDRARVRVNDKSGYTAEVSNPVPEKTETDADGNGTPGDGVMVKVGDDIGYRIHWKNDQAQAAHVYIVDPLDIGATFKSARFGEVTLSADEDEDDAYAETTGRVDGVEVALAYNGTAETIQGEEGVPAMPPRSVLWDLGEQAAGAQGDVFLTVTVNENAVATWTYEAAKNEGAAGEGDDYQVVDRAEVHIGEQHRFTAQVENPIPEKEEVSPGEGRAVETGRAIDYRVHWKNGHDEAAAVTVRDPLDKGVDFVSAAFETVSASGEPMVVTVGQTAQDRYGDVSVAYDAEKHEVVWKLANRPAKEAGEVLLTVRVNASAEPAGKVENQAFVGVGNDAEVATRIIPNPLGPGKTETHVNGEDVTDALTPAEGGLRGPEVEENDTVTYRIHWVNDAARGEGASETLIDARVTVVDPLDQGVDFVAAGLSPSFEDGLTLNAGDEKMSGEDAQGAWSVEFDAQRRAVIWALESRAAGSGGDVYLTVRVNRRSLSTWQYGEGDTPTVDESTNDDEIVNRAQVAVENGSAQYTDVMRNPLRLGELTVTKTVTGEHGDPEKLFHFRVELDDKSVNGEYGQMTFKDGAAEIELKHGGSLTASGLRAGLHYTVTELEANQNQYVTTAEGDEGVIVAGEEAVAAFVNDMQLPPVPETGDDADRWLLLTLISGIGLTLTALAGRRRAGSGRAK